MNSQTANNIAPEASDVVTIKGRPLLFLVAYFIGVIILTGISTYQRLSRYPFEVDWSVEISEIFGDFLAILVFLPMGLVRVLERTLNIIGIRGVLINPDGYLKLPSSVGVLVGLFDYLLLFIISLTGSSTKKQRTFRVLYFLFLGLLLINIGGCSMGMM